MNNKDFLDSVCVQPSNIENVNILECQKILEENEIVCIKQAFKQELISDIKSNFVEKFNPANDQVHNPKDFKLIMDNFQKIVNVDGERARFLRIFFNPIFSEDIYNMRTVFVQMSKFRNKLYGLPVNFAIEKDIEDNFWTASRIHQYPSGGGFMYGHKDSILSGISRVEGLQGYYQIILILSKKGVDYIDGGPYLEIEDRKIYFEEHYDPGDIVVYNGTSYHGVDPIDPELEEDNNRVGRLAAFVSLYKYLG